MSLQTILEGDSNKSGIDLVAETVTAESLQTNFLTGAGAIYTDYSPGASGQSASETLTTLIAETLAEGEVVLIHWSCQISSILALAAQILVTYDLGGQGQVLGVSDYSTTGITLAGDGDLLVTGFFTFEIDAAGAGAGKLISFNVTGTNVQVGECQHALFKIAHLIV